MESSGTSYAYVAAGTDGLRVLDVTNPSSPVEVDLDNAELVEFNARDVRIDGNRAYLAAGELGIVVFDVLDPERPEEIARLSLEDTSSTGEATVVEATSELLNFGVTLGTSESEELWTVGEDLVSE